MSESSERNRLPSSAEGRLRLLRGDLVLQLYLRRDPLWGAVRDIRDRWNIAAKVQLPPSVTGWLLPESAPEFDNDDREKYKEKYRKYLEYGRRWDDEMSAIRLKVVPEPSLSTQEIFDYKLKESWNKFLSACALYDPPEDRLLEFASYGNLEPSYLSGDLFPERSRLEERHAMVYPPVKSLWTLTKVRDWYWQRVLDYIGERYLEPQDVDVQALLDSAVFNIPGLYEENLEKARQYSKRFYVEVDEYTTLEDVKNAFRLIRSVQEERPKGIKPPRDRLTAVQCALLYDRHNSADPQDNRRRRWTYAKLAQRFGLSSPRAAKDYVALGREILNEEDSEKR